ncbi:DNA primase [Paenibacillus flagellatus]|uniref:DNA primase n=1 Tax=Paenibacillus flagellatus TaxID=2211139 RepID=A0A2V5KCZ8_9BACL|nr:DNA primase [Paenibacillus flagellatus]PYI51750.1 DNA primase [Paenibacillus flagellatus]
MSSGRIPEDIIEAVLKHHDIVDVIGKYVHLTKHGRNLKGLCPFHSEKSPSFNVNPEKQIFKCFGCGIGGHVIRFIQEIEGYTFGEAVRHLAEEANIDFGWEQQTPEQAERQQERDQIVKGHEFAAKLYHYILNNSAEGKAALDYLRSRGFTDSLIETFQIGYAPPRWDVLAQYLEQRQFSLPLMEKGALIAAKSSGGGYVDKFRNRVMFPIRDARGNVIAFAGRTMGNEQPKYLNSPETSLFRKSRVLYNFHAARAEIKRTSRIVLFEGYADVIKAWSAGVHNGVATMGTALTEDHALMMRRSAEQVVICYDGDEAGQAAAYKNLDILAKAGLDIKVALLPNRLDPDEYIESFGAEKFRRDIIEAAVPTDKFKLIHLRRNFNMQDNEAKLRYVRTAIREVIAHIESPTVREHHLKELANEFSSISSFETMKQETNEIREEQQKKRRSGDNNDFSWNTVMNDGTDSVPLPKLKPAYDKAERHLLYVMMHDRDVAAQVQERLGDAFNDEAHAAMAAYLYAYYAQGFEPDASRYLTALQDDKLERLASSILMTESDQGINEQVIEDYIREIRKHRQQQAIERMEQERVRVEKSGDVIGAARIAIEIIALKNQLKAM